MRTIDHRKRTVNRVARLRHLRNARLAERPRYQFQKNQGFLVVWPTDPRGFAKRPMMAAHDIGEISLTRWNPLAYPPYAF